jgi:hypothetical protein
MKPFTDIQNRLAQQVPALRYIDEDWGQLDYYEGHPPVQFPCALIDCGDIAVTQMGGRVMLDKISVVIRIADLRLSNTSNAAPQTQKTAAYQLFETLQQVICALHGYTGSPDVYGRLVRTAGQRIRRKDGIKMYELTFECLLRNTAAQQNLVAVQATPQINVDTI